MALSKAIRMNLLDKKKLKKIIELDPGIEGDHYSEEMRRLFEEFAAQPMDLKLIKKIKIALDDVEVSDEPQTVTFNVPDATYLKVVNIFREQLDLKSPKISFMARQLMDVKLYRLMNLEAEQTTVSNLDGVELIKKLAILLGKEDAASKAKVLDIKNILIEEE